jgi:hypothetical protein
MQSGDERGGAARRASSGERLRRAAWLFGLRIAAPLAAGALFTWGVLAVTGFGADGRPGVPLRNLLLPPFILVVVWNAGVTIGTALADRNRSRSIVGDRE